MNQQEIKLTRSYAEHFDGDLKLAAAAFHLGLGIVKMFRASQQEPPGITDAVGAAIKATYNAIAGKGKPPAETPAKRYSRMNKAELLDAASKAGVEVTPEMKNKDIIAALKAGK